MAFLRQVVQSLYNLRWISLRRHESNSAWSYALLFLFLITIVQFSPLLWEVPRAVRSIGDIVESDVPEFRAELRNGILSVYDVEQPFVRTYTDGDTSIVIVVDTVTTTPQDIRSLLPDEEAIGVLITATSMTTYEGYRSQGRIQEWRTMPDGEITRADLLRFWEKISGFIGYFFVPILMAIIFLSWAVGKLTYLAFVSIVVYIIALIGGRAWKYHEVFTVGLFALTLPTIFQVVSYWAELPLPWVYTLLLGIYMIGAVLVSPKEKDTSPATPTI